MEGRIMKKNDLLKMTVETALKSVKPPVNEDGSEAVCKSYSYKQIKHYLADNVNEREKDAFKQHISHCDICFYGLARARDEMENIRLKDIAMEAFRNYSNKLIAPQIVRIIASWKGKIAEIIEATGEIINVPDLSYVTRSGEQKITPAEKKKCNLPPLKRKMQQEFADPPILMEASIDTQEDGSAFVLQLSLIDKNQDEPVLGLDLKMEGAGVSLRAKSNERGEASFVLHEAGSYNIFISRSDELLLNVNLDLRES
jgi:hypothetical protein